MYIITHIIVGTQCIISCTINKYYYHATITLSFALHIQIECKRPLRSVISYVHYTNVCLTLTPANLLVVTLSKYRARQTFFCNLSASEMIETYSSTLISPFASTSKSGLGGGKKSHSLKTLFSSSAFSLCSTALSFDLHIKKNYLVFSK